MSYEMPEPHAPPPAAARVDDYRLWVAQRHVGTNVAPLDWFVDVLDQLAAVEAERDEALEEADEQRQVRRNCERELKPLAAALAQAQGHVEEMHWAILDAYATLLPNCAWVDYQQALRRIVDEVTQARATLATPAPQTGCSGQTYREGGPDDRRR